MTVKQARADSVAHHRANRRKLKSATEISSFDGEDKKAILKTATGEKVLSIGDVDCALCQHFSGVCANCIIKDCEESPWYDIWDALKYLDLPAAIAATEAEIKFLLALEI